MVTGEWTNEFYRDYAEHLQEKEVQNSHDLVYNIFSHLTSDHDLFVVDYGCGTGEFDSYFNPVFCDRSGNYKYFGIDKNIVNYKLPHHVGDFLREEIELPFRPTAFVSIFATELIMSVEQRYAFYKKTFDKYPLMKFGLVSGVIYPGKEQEEMIQEENGFKIYQSNENQYYSSPFNNGWKTNNISPIKELRIYQEVESKMWGKVVEVWKIFTKGYMY
jgi:hypothetical protein